MLLEKRARVIELALAWPGAKPPVRQEKRRVGIEALLRWAYREELPKEGAAPVRERPSGFMSAWMCVERSISDLSGMNSAAVNRFGLIPDQLAQSAPHPDAIAVAAAAGELDGLELGVPDDWDPFSDLGDMGGLKAAAIADVIGRLTATGMDGKRRLKAQPSRLVAFYAVMGGCPDCRAEVPEVKFVRGANGREKWFIRKQLVAADGVPYEFETDGMSARAKRPLHGAYRKQYLDPDPIDAGVSRGEYEVWRASLDVVSELLEGRLESVEPVLSSRPLRPWEDGYHAPQMLPVVHGLGK